MYNIFRHHMNRSILICFIFFSSQIHLSFSQQRELSKGTAMVFGADVLLRNIPSTQGVALDVIPIASKIEILDKASLLTNMGNINDYWYKVKYNETEGFIWGTLIADNYYENDMDNDSLTETFMILNLSKNYFDEGFNTTNSRIEIRLARNGQLIYEHKRQIGYKFICDSIRSQMIDITSAKLNILRLHYGFSGATEGKAEQFFKINNEGLDSLFTMVTYEGEGGYVSFGNLIFPNDKDGIPNSIVINYKYCTDITGCDDKAIPCKWEFDKNILSWDGKSFTLKQ
jgi:hypothetical protein